MVHKPLKNPNSSIHDDLVVNVEVYKTEQLKTKSKSWLQTTQTKNLIQERQEIVACGIQINNNPKKNS
uniref:Putative ovule protein n=1 Tax=Solanum chacoense TaxID=4108 RepID=A0A0V0I2A8_SOLCH